MAPSRTLLLLAMAVAFLATASALKKGDGTAYSGECPPVARRRRRRRRRAPARATASAADWAAQPASQAACGTRSAAVAQPAVPGGGAAAARLPRAPAGARSAVVDVTPHAPPPCRPHPTHPCRCGRGQQDRIQLLPVQEAGQPLEQVLRRSAIAHVRQEEGAPVDGVVAAAGGCRAGSGPAALPACRLAWPGQPLHLASRCTCRACVSPPALFLAPALTRLPAPPHPLCPHCSTAASACASAAQRRTRPTAG